MTLSKYPPFILLLSVLLLSGCVNRQESKQETVQERPPYTQVSQNLSIDENTNIYLDKDGTKVALTENGGTSKGCGEHKKLTYSSPVLSPDQKYLVLIAQCEDEPLEIMLKEISTEKRYSLGQSQQKIKRLKVDFKKNEIDFQAQTEEGGTVNFDLPNPFLPRPEPSIDHGAVSWDGKDAYGFYYLPLGEEEHYKKQENKLLGGHGGMRIIPFTIDELLTGSLRTLKESVPYYSLGLNTGMYGELTAQDVVRNVARHDGRMWFEVSFRKGMDHCLYSLERITEEYVALFSGCGLKAAFGPGKMSLLSPNELKVKLDDLEAERIKAIKTPYYAFQNTIRRFSGGKEQILFKAGSPFDFKQLACEEILGAPALLCDYRWFESYERPFSLYFTETNLLKNLEVCGKTETVRAKAQKPDTIIATCYEGPTVKFDYMGNQR